ncbi:WcaI family glycosyltransferase [Frigidibacter sp. ROC022]|uniref:WcaI family glycosyltransferase n=1 Tax=Frigidibacter sp. ROC022 TaxID=2971796 RepID=UPI00215B769F|nr:WcaI family glycosyltransferase [Frigidibacter sp. ROC022]MCR8724579.1 WcaI family glycosyltransferase [Frigidibacter sp. ROC022]
MRLLILGINYAPEIISTAVYTTGLAEDMARRGDEVAVVTAVPYYPAWKVASGWRQRWRRERREGVTVTHCPLYVPARPTGARRILHHASFALTALPVMLWSALRRRPDLVLVIAPSLVAAPVGWLAARLTGARAWLHIQDFEVEAAFATGLLAESSRVGRAAVAFERWLLRRFDRISTISGPMLKKLCQKQVPEARVFELRNWANLAAVRPLDGPSPLRKALGIDRRHVVLYSGNLANKQGLEIIPEVARRLAHRDDLAIAVCGDGPMCERLLRSARGLPALRCFPLQPPEKLSDLLGMADIHLLPQIGGAADLVLPSKLTNMLASGRPVIATARPDTALGREVEGCGCLTPPGDAGALAAAIEALLDDPAERARLGAAARARAIERWNGEVILDRLHREFLRMLAVPDPSGLPHAVELAEEEHR